MMYVDYSVGNTGLDLGSNPLFPRLGSREHAVFALWIEFFLVVPLATAFTQ